jgi:hypothetical protein
MQGFLFSKARPPEDIPALVAGSLEHSPPLQPFLIDPQMSFRLNPAEAN